MNQLTFWGLAVGGLMVMLYVGAAWRHAKRPDLATAVNVLVSAVGAAGAVRLIGFAFTEQFSKLASAHSSGSWWSLSPGDAVFLVVGGLALFWVSCQAIMKAFRELRTP